MNEDLDVTGSYEQTRSRVYSPSWQLLEETVEFDAGHAGPEDVDAYFWGKRAADELVSKRRTDLTGTATVPVKWWHFVTDHLFSVRAVVDGDTRLVHERAEYDAHGRPKVLLGADIAAPEGVLNVFDTQAFIAWYNAQDPRADANGDGLLNVFDIQSFTAMYNQQLSGAGSLTNADDIDGPDNTVGYAGYHWDPELGLWLSRHRVYDPGLGRWLQRDPAGYVDGMSLYAYVMGNPFSFVDPTGLATWLGQQLTNLGGWLKSTNTVAGDIAAGAAFGSAGAVETVAGGVSAAAGYVASAANETMTDGASPLGIVLSDIANGIDQGTRNVIENQAAASGTAPDYSADNVALTAAAVATGLQRTADAVAGLDSQTNQPLTGLDRWGAGIGGVGQGVLTLAAPVTGGSSILSRPIRPLSAAPAAAPSVPGVSLRRPYIRQSVRESVEAAAPRTRDGRFIDPNTRRPIDGSYDLGHKPGHEFRREKAKAEAEGLTQRDFNDRMNNPDLYQIEDPSSNRSRRYEKKDEDD